VESGSTLEVVDRGIRELLPWFFEDALAVADAIQCESARDAIHSLAFLLPMMLEFARE
jgi:hypothetical protein